MQQTKIKIFFYFILFLLCVNFSVCWAEDSEILFLSSVRQIEANKLTCIDTVVLQINNRKGETACEFALQYTKSNKLIIDNATIEDFLGNTVRTLKNSEILTRNAFSGSSTLYQDEFIKEFQLRHNVFPYRIKLCYRRFYHNFLLDIWQPLEDIWQNHNILGCSVRKAKLVVEMPANYEIRYKSENIAEPLIVRLTNRKFLIWETEYTGRQWELYAPRSALKIPTVSIVPLHFKYGVAGSWASWESFGEWVTRLNAKTQNLSPEEQQKISQMLTGASSVRQKIEILYQYLQNTTRYVNVKINTGGFRSYSADYVANNKYGDCKALSTYMMAMLKYANIPACYTLIQAGDNINHFDKDFPSQVFNHVIVTVPLPDDTLFLECTEKNIPCGYMGTFTQNREALVTGEKTYFVHIHALTENQVTSSTKIEVNLNTYNNAVKLQIVARGHLYSLLSYIANNLNTKSIERYLQNVLATGRLKLENYKIEKAERSQAEIYLSAELLANGVQQIYDHNIILAPFSHTLPDFEKPADRTQNLQLNYPICYSDTNIYILPQEEKYQITQPNANFESDFGNYNFECKVIKNQLVIIKNCVIFSGNINIEKYTDFYEFIQKIKNIETQSIHLYKVQYIFTNKRNIITFAKKNLCLRYESR